MSLDVPGFDKPLLDKKKNDAIFNSEIAGQKDFGSRYNLLIFTFFVHDMELPVITVRTLWANTVDGRMTS